METITEAGFNEQHSLQRSTILRVYNYYRILISFLFVFLFLDKSFGEFVGAANPELFQRTIVVYLIANIIIGLSPLLLSKDFMARPTVSFVILTLDIIALSLLMSASGGVASGLGNFLIFTVAFAGGLIRGKISTVLPAIAFILTIYVESYLFFLDQNDIQSFFQAGILGIVYFVSNIFFQTLSRQLHRRESELFTLEQINQIIVDQMRSGVAVVNKDGELKLINASGKQMIYPQEQDKEADTLPENLMAKVDSTVSGNLKQTFTYSAVRDAPTLLVTLSKIRTSGPQQDSLFFFEDSTEIQRQAQQLKLAALGRLSASIAHEIRNPLGAISHAAQLLGESQKLDAGDKRLSDIIQNHCVRMNSVIENVLQMSRRKTAEPKTLNLETFLNEFIQEFSAGYDDPCQIEVESYPKAINVEFDPIHLSQVLGNLCQNGLRYSAKKTGVHKVSIVIGVEELSGVAYLNVIDFGLGVQNDLVANLFEPFYTTETSGTGLGLYLSKELCEANNATLSYSNSDVRGSCFHITFFQSSRY
jgi:two-component system, NtrC family, sensor histidine kinase PilS